MDKKEEMRMNDVEEDHDDMYSMWKEFNSTVRAQMAEAMEAGQSEYRQLHESWADMAKGMAEFSDLLDPTVPETMEVYNVWRNYAVKMARRMDNVMSERQDRFDRLFEAWVGWTSEIGTGADEAGHGDGSEMFERTYLDWLVFSGRFLAEIVKGKDGTGANVAELMRTWTSFSRMMTDALDRLVKNGGEKYRDASKAWLEFINAVGEKLDEFTHDTEKDFNQLYETWLRESQSLGRKMARAVPNGNGAHEHPKHAVKADGMADVATGGGVSK
jgi:hypothetical protein